MRDHDLELMAALAEGRLDDETEARAIVDSSPELRAEYEAQVTALAALSTAGIARMRDPERSALHRDLWTELGAGRGHRAGKNPWYYRWTPVAAGLLVIVGLVAVVSQGGGNDSSPEAAVFASQTTTAAEADGADAGGGGSAAPTDGATSSPDDLTGELSARDLAYYDAEADKIRENDEARITTESADEEGSQNQLQDCIDAAGLSGYRALGTLPAPTTTAEDEDVAVPLDAAPFIIAIPDDADLVVAPIAFVDLIACDVIHVDR